jgi:hypothetical protein
VVVGNDIELTLDVEAINLDALERTGAIEYYRTTGSNPGQPPEGRPINELLHGCP